MVTVHRKSLPPPRLCVTTCRGDSPPPPPFSALPRPTETLLCSTLSPVHQSICPSASALRLLPLPLTHANPLTREVGEGAKGPPPRRPRSARDTTALLLDWSPPSASSLFRPSFASRAVRRCPSLSLRRLPASDPSSVVAGSVPSFWRCRPSQTGEMCCSSSSPFRGMPFNVTGELLLGGHRGGGARREWRQRRLLAQKSGKAPQEERFWRSGDARHCMRVNFTAIVW